MKRKTAIFMALLMALQSPISALASLPGMDAAGETEWVPPYGEESGDTDGADGSGGEDAGRYGDEETATPGNAGHQTEPMTPSDALPPGGPQIGLMMAMQMPEIAREGTLAIEIHGVVPSKASFWQAELYLKGDSAEERTLAIYMLKQVARLQRPRGGMTCVWFRLKWREIRTSSCRRPRICLTSRRILRFGKVRIRCF